MNERKQATLAGLIVVGGLLLSLAVLWFFVFRTSSGRHNAKGSAAERMREFRDAAPQMGGMAQRFFEMRKRWEQLQFQGDDRKVAEAISGLFQNLTPKVIAYDQSLQNIAEAGYAKPPFPERSEIARRTSLLHVFRAANADLATAFRGIAGELGKALEKTQTPSALAEANIRSFLAALNVDQTLELRDIDEKSADVLTQMAQLFDDQWGRWKEDDSGVIQFENAAFQARFVELQAKIDSLAERQVAIQEEISRREREK